MRGGVRKVEEFGAKLGTYTRWGAKRVFGGGGKGGSAVDDAFRARPIRTLRQDNDFEAHLNDYGKPKSHTENGDLVPNDPNNNITALQHILADKDAKAVSQYTSFSTRDSATKPKYYGSQEITVDTERLARDIAAGKVKGVGILSPQQIQGDLRAEINRVAPGVDIDAAIAGGKDTIEDVLSHSGLSQGAIRKARSRLTALYFTTRDGEWLISGVIPKNYIVHEGHTVPGAVGSATGSGSGRDDDR